MQVEINGNINDISAMLAGAVRYALGRRTYIVNWTCEFIAKNQHLLTEANKKVIIRDLENCDYYGDECDKEDWLKLLERLKEGE